MEKMTFWGYRRPDGRVGIRNKILILPASVCASDTTRIIASQVESAVTFNNQNGCSQVPSDQQFTMDVMAGYAANPNVYGTVVVSLGCENCQMDLVLDAIKERTNKPIRHFIIQENGGTISTVEKAVRAAKEMAQEASLLQKEEFDFSELIIGTECGGSDPTSGLTTLEEKSLGCIHKGGHSEVTAVYDYAKQVEPKQGLVIMDTPGNDPSSVAAMVAGGCQIVVFSTGRGTPTGNPLAPVIKITGNKVTFANMSDNIDIDASPYIYGTKTMTELGDELMTEIKEVADGKLTKAEALGYTEMASVVIVSGGARGADALAKRYAVDRGYCYMEFPADWDTYGRRAGYIRNRAMHEYISTHENRGVIAFWDGKSRGTRQSFSLAGSYSNPLRVVHVPVA